MSPALTSADGLPLTADLEPLVQRVLDAARAAGATQAEASLSHSRGLSVSVRKGEVESLEFQRDRGLSMTVYFGHRKGSASTGDLSDGGIRQAVEAACAIARLTEEDPFSGLADATRLASRREAAPARAGSSGAGHRDRHDPHRFQRRPGRRTPR